MNRYSDLPPGCTPNDIEDAMADAECFSYPSRGSTDCKRCSAEARKDCQEDYNKFRYAGTPALYWSDALGWVTVPPDGEVTA